MQIGRPRASHRPVSSPGTIDAYYKGSGNGYRAGELLVQADYAKTLSLIASEGREVFL